MNMEEIQKRLAQVDAAKGDPEIAHGLEDMLLEDFIKSIAADETNPMHVEAKLVLTVSDIKFDRWYS